MVQNRRPMGTPCWLHVLARVTCLPRVHLPDRIRSRAVPQDEQKVAC